MIQTIIQKRHVFPAVTREAGKSATIARQLDTALMQNGFKLSHALFTFVAESNVCAALEISGQLIAAVKQELGAHVQHNVYFKDFPKNVPDTIDFWTKCIIDWFLTGASEYGRYQHSYEEMLAVHSKLKLVNPKFKLLDLGESLEREQHKLFTSLATSRIPLNPDDRTLLAKLAKSEYLTGLVIPVRENKAILNALRIRVFSLPLDLDTPIDVLRLAVYLSGGDETLTTNTKFKSFKRSERRAIMHGLDELLAKQPAKIDDVSPYREEFKRLAKYVHPREFPELEFAGAMFDYVFGGKRTTKAHLIFTALQTKDFSTAIDLLSDQPGRLVRSLDHIMRACTKAEFKKLLSSLKDVTPKVSSRVLLSALQHLENRVYNPDYQRLIINKAGKGFALTGTIPAVTEARYKQVKKVILEVLEAKLPVIPHLVLGADLGRISIPLSNKNQSSGHAVLPRGSTFKLDASKKLLRFFTYWKQREHRTDYDLSCIFLDANFEFIQQLSWTNLRESQFGYHSGDLTDATNGATEMIDILLDKLPANVKFIVPSVNQFAGETFEQTEESIFGFMERNETEKGLPYEASPVRTKFELRGPNKLFLPMVFSRETEGWVAKWVDINLEAQSWGNRVEKNSVTQTQLIKAVYQKRYLNIELLTTLLKRKATLVSPAGKRVLAKDSIIYIGLERPEGIHAAAKCITLQNLGELIAE
jgi:stress response protein SCP2